MILSICYSEWSIQTANRVYSQKQELLKECLALEKDSQFDYSFKSYLHLTVIHEEATYVLFRMYFDFLRNTVTKMSFFAYQMPDFCSAIYNSTADDFKYLNHPMWTKFEKFIKVNLQHVTNVDQLEADYDVIRPFLIDIIQTDWQYIRSLPLMTAKQFQFLIGHRTIFNENTVFYISFNYPFYIKLYDTRKTLMLELLYNFEQGFPIED